MWRFLILGLLVATSLPAFATRQVTVAQLEQAVAAAQRSSDADLAQQLSLLELTQRLSAATLANIKAQLPGNKAREELDILADQSAFLALPPAEIPSKPAPDTATQRQIMALVVQYVTTTIRQLPNFLATRETTGFEDRPQAAFAYLPMHRIGQSAISVLYRDGKEVYTKEAKGESTASANGLTSMGEFGTILSTVLLDAARSRLEWSHWEQSAAGPLAVFRYEVPSANSHYEVQHNCVQTAGPQSTDAPRPPGAPLNNSKIQYNTTCPPQPDRTYAAYHGEMAIDPATGAILRLTLVADLKPGDPLLTSSIMVSYSTVAIGGKSYICPTRSIAIAKTHISVPTIGAVPAEGMEHTPIITRMNTVVFDQYHVFRVESHLLIADQTGDQGQAPPAAGNTTAESANPAVAAAAPTEAETATTPAKANAEGSATGTTLASAAATPSPSPSIQTSKAEAPQPAVVSPSQSAPANVSETQPPAAATPPQAQFTPPSVAGTQQSAVNEAPLFKTTTRDVIRDVVVTKGNGEPVLGLNQKNFEVKEDGEPQKIDFFEAHTANNASASAPPAMPPMPTGMSTNVPPAPPGDAVNVLLIDTLNTPQLDQAYIRSEVIDFLTKMRPGTRMAIFTLGSKLRFVQGFTTDSSALLAALQDKTNGLKTGKNPTFQSRDDKAADAEIAATLETMRASGEGIAAIQEALSDAGAHEDAARASMTVDALMYLGHYLAGIPGRKNLLWFAGTFPVSIFPTPRQLAQYKQGPGRQKYVASTSAIADQFTASQIAVYPIGAEGIMTEHMAEASSDGPGSSENGAHGGSMADSNMDPYQAGAAERAATISAMQQLATSTGGKAYYNRNDLGTAVENAIDNGANYYTIGYDPTDKKMDGSYRKIDIKVAGRYTLAYQRGYNADATPAEEAKTGSGPLVSLLGFGLPNATGVLYGVRAEVADTQPSPDQPHAGRNLDFKGPFTRYNVYFLVRAQSLQFEPDQNGGRTGKFVVGLKAYDPDGKALNWEAHEETVKIRPGQYDSVRKEGIPVHLEFDLPSIANIELVTAVYDLGSDQAGTQGLHVTDAAEAGGAKPLTSTSH